jgi:SAM-dependent methyltransferase
MKWVINSMKFRKYVQVETEFNKKYASKNPIIVSLNNHFLSRLISLVESVNSTNILDVGCGEGAVANFLNNKPSIKANQIAGLDIELNRLRIARAINPELQFYQGSIYNLPFQNNSFDLVLALEVLEHLEFPEKAIGELNRVSRDWIVISVPNDWMFRLGNMLRFKYLSSWGRTPSHIQHWGKRKFTGLILKYMRIIKIKTPLFLWLIFLCHKKKGDR